MPLSSLRSLNFAIGNIKLYYGSNSNKEETYSRGNSCLCRAASGVCTCWSREGARVGSPSLQMQVRAGVLSRAIRDGGEIVTEQLQVLKHQPFLRSKKMAASNRSHFHNPRLLPPSFFLPSFGGVGGGCGYLTIRLPRRSRRKRIP